MNEFLLFWRDLAKENPHLRFDSPSFRKTIYHHLIRLGVSEKEKTFNANKQGLFDDWTNTYQKKENISVFVDPNWSYFCQFVNVKQKTNFFKIYIPTKAEYLKDNAKIIFDYLKNNNIAHLSKIGQEIRFDNIVIRLERKEDVLPLLTFLQNNQKIQKGLLPPNPFAFTKDNIALAYDGNLSYNQIICSYIRLYISYKKKTNTLDSVNADDFISFIKTYYNSNLKDMANLYEIANEFDEDERHHVFYDIKDITKLIVSAYSKDFNYNDYLQLVEDNSKKYLPRQKNENNQNINDFLLKAYQIMCSKYNQENVMEMMNAYITTGNPLYITSKDNLRNLVIEYKLREKMLVILQNTKLDFKAYLNSLIKVRDEKIMNIKSILLLYLKTMMNKHGFDVACRNLNGFLSTKNPLFITRDNSLRDTFTNPSFYQELKDFLEKNNIDLNAYLTSLKEELEPIKAK